MTSLIFKDTENSITKRVVANLLMFLFNFDDDDDDDDDHDHDDELNL